jgi:hypothetical protein
VADDYAATRGGGGTSSAIKCQCLANDGSMRGHVWTVHKWLGGSRRDYRRSPEEENVLRYCTIKNGSNREPSVTGLAHRRSHVGVRRGSIHGEALEKRGSTLLSRSPGFLSVARHAARYAGRCPSVPPTYSSSLCSVLPTDGSQDGCEGQRGHFRNILWSGQRRERMAMMNNEHEGIRSRRPCKAAGTGSMASVSRLLLSIPMLREATWHLWWSRYPAGASVGLPSVPPHLLPKALKGLWRALVLLGTSRPCARTCSHAGVRHDPVASGEETG